MIVTRVLGPAGVPITCMCTRLRGCQWMPGPRSGGFRECILAVRHLPSHVVLYQTFRLRRGRFEMWNHGLLICYQT